MIEEFLIKLASIESLPDPLPSDPMPLLASWYRHAGNEARQPNPDAMTLATCVEGIPSARIVLCKKIDPVGALHFFTNYESRKGAELEANPRAAVAFLWDHDGRQARGEGVVEKLSPEESDAYFNTRALLSRLGAWASKQSRPLTSRMDLIREVASAARRMHLDVSKLNDRSAGIVIPRPPYWGGFRLMLTRVELWCGGNGRLHDRAAWTRDQPMHGPWHAERLYP
ncbi:MAG: pyridoxamine 5'-phosphate oxidase [Planctomycetota bacterium]|nr:pyridoxamine 5'-phosphate oxidase [Planctomycetota bacterium]